MNATQAPPGMLRRYHPILTWGAAYSRRTLANDLIAAAFVTVMPIPQGLACAAVVSGKHEADRPGASQSDGFYQGGSE